MKRKPNSLVDEKIYENAGKGEVILHAISQDYVKSVVMENGK